MVCRASAGARALRGRTAHLRKRRRDEAPGWPRGPGDQGLPGVRSQGPSRKNRWSEGPGDAGAQTGAGSELVPAGCGRAAKVDSEGSFSRAGGTPADRPRRGGPVRGAVTWLDIRLAASQESSPRPISTPGRSRRHCSGWVSGVWGGRCWSVFTACWLCSEKI